jgi:predicted ATPase/DNA-binding CsgD family transcriptional regulator/tRNA A-37 threonylcarbamoyl transferase component Bud32
MIDRVGQQLGNYRLLRLLGRGGFADVYLGEHIYLKSQAALKVMRMSLTEEERAAFIKEAQTLMQLAHPNIVRVLDFAIEDDQPFLVMIYAPNGTLRERHPAGSRLPMDTIVTYVEQVASALQHAHDQGFIHRDVKPENMLLGAGSEVLLSDFGLSVFASHTDPQYSTHQIAQAVAGTSRYMAPEQLQGHPQPASDQYALGVVVYEWLCGTSPFLGTPIEIAMQHLSRPPSPLREQVPDLSPDIEEIVQQALAKEPEQRFASVKDFAMALQDAAQAASPSLTFHAPIAERKVLRRAVKPEPLWKVPTTFTTLVGREQDVAAIEAMLIRPEVRLLTLLGTGGIGKSRLALQVARRMRAFFADGVCFAGLASTSDPTLIPLIIEETLGIQQSVNLSIFKQVEFFLRDKHLLLILDNFEQVVTAAPLIEDLLTACPLLKIVVTSRAVLHLQAEYEYPVAPLTLPDLEQSPTSEDLAHSAAIALFVQRAQAVLPSFRLTQANAHTIAEICMQLDGLPLAIELAAARSRLLPPQALLARLSRRFEVLTGGAQTLPARQQTLRNTLKWSYDLLDANEQQLFRRLAVFVGGWTLEAVEALANAVHEPQDAVAVLNGMASLIDKSLVLQVEKEGTEPHFAMLRTVREYGLDCLREYGEEEHIQRVHADYYLALAVEAEPHLRGEQQLLWLRRLDREQGNLRAALGWLIAHEEVEKTLRFCVALWRFWQIRGYLSEGRRWLKAVLALPGTGERPAVRARALSAAGELAGVQGDWREAHLLISESVALYRELGDDSGLVLPLSTLGWVLVKQGDPAAGILLMEESIVLCRKLGLKWELSNVLFWLAYNAYLQGDLAQVTALTQESLALARELGDKTLIARALNNLGYTIWLQGDPVRATALAQEGLMLFRELGDKALITSALETLGSIALSQGDLERAIACFTDGLSVAQELGNQTFIAWHLMGLARMAVAQAQLKRAARLFGAVEIRYDVNKELNPNQRDDYERMISSVRAQLGEQAFAAAWSEGYTMTLEQILAATEPVSTSEPFLPAGPSRAIVKPSRAPTYPDNLTVREVEVLRLLAQGRTDAQIAEHLVISRRTVNTHLTSIYRKIQVSSRSAATRYAVDRKLL